MKAKSGGELHPIEKLFFDTIQDFRLLEKGDKVLVAFSGGPDSCALLHLLSLQPDIIPIACHINHNLRKTESLRDEKFSGDFAKSRNIPFYKRSIDVTAYSKQNKLSTEDAARQLRYHALEEVRLECGADRIATGHNLDDLSETMLFRLFKGTGTGGILSIPIARGMIIRPLLFAEKADIVDYLKSNEIPFVKDSSNDTLDYDRNYIRHRITPPISARFPSFRRKISEFYRIALEEEKYWKEELSKISHYYRIEDNLVVLEKKVFENIPFVLARRLVRSLIMQYLDREFFPTLQQTDYIIQASKNKNGNRILLKTKRFRIISSYHDILFVKGQKKFPILPKYVTLNDSIKLNVTRFNIFIQQTGFAGEPEGSCCFFNENNLKGLTIRSWQPGDRIRFKNGTKKLQDYFVDSKIDALSRQDSIVFEADQNSGSIVAVFVPGHGFRVSTDYYTSESGQNWSIRIENLKS